MSITDIANKVLGKEVAVAGLADKKIITSLRFFLKMLGCTVKSNGKVLIISHKTPGLLANACKTAKKLDKTLTWKQFKPRDYPSMAVEGRINHALLGKKQDILDMLDRKKLVKSTPSKPVVKAKAKRKPTKK